MLMNWIRNRFKGAAADSLLLTFVKIITALLGLLTTKLLSKQLSLQDYGTYSQAMLLVSTVTAITILGLSDATNYFYNNCEDDDLKQKYISTVFCIQYVLGIFSGIIICILMVPIVGYFNNPDLRKVIFYAAWMPVFLNLIPMLQVLFISIGKAKIIAVRNFVVSVARLIIVSLTVFLFKDIRLIFILTLLLDIIQTLYFYHSFSKYRFTIKLSNFDRHYVKPILVFSIPMAVFVFTSALSRDIDKYVISYFTDTETLAVYTNAAKVLPFDMLTASFLTVLIPIVTRQVRSENYIDAQKTLKAYLRIGYLGTWILVAGGIVTAREMMLFFYDDKYLSGLNVFIVYLFVDMIRFANTSLILSAKGKTKSLMKWSIISLFANFIFNVLAFYVWGLIGPAITTLVITLGLMCVYLFISAKELNTSVRFLFDWKEIVIEISELVLIGIIFYFGKKALYLLFDSYLLVFFTTYVLFLIVMIIINKRRLIDCLRTINQMK